MLAPLLSLMAAAWLVAAPSDATAPTCRSIDGHVACGYQCKSDGQRLRCAQTPQGSCQLIDGQAVCFDAPPHIVRIYGGSPPTPECKAIDGQVACGYRCATQPGKVRCARTPAGICTGRSGKVVCFDPPAEVYAVYGQETPRTECKGYGEDVACGYNCTVGPGRVACSRTPMGVCKSDSLRLSCFDPPAGLLCSQGKSLPPLQCQSSDNQPVCGYNCTKAFSKSACAATPKGVCKVFDSEVVCFDPPLTEEASAACLSILGLATLQEP